MSESVSGKFHGLITPRQRISPRPAPDDGWRGFSSPLTHARLGHEMAARPCGPATYRGNRALHLQPGQIRASAGIDSPARRQSRALWRSIALRPAEKCLAAFFDRARSPARFVRARRTRGEPCQPCLIGRPRNGNPPRRWTRIGDLDHAFAQDWPLQTQHAGIDDVMRIKPPLRLSSSARTGAERVTARRG